MLHIHLLCLFASWATYPQFVFGDQPTFTFGPASNYRVTDEATATPTGSDVLIRPSDVSKGIPSTGLEFFFGPDQQTAMKKSRDGKCKNGVSEDCINELIGIIDNRSTFSIQARVVAIDDFLYVLAAMAAAAVAYMLAESSDHASRVRLPADAVSTLQSISSTPFAFATSSGAPPLTFSSLATPTVTVSSASITTLSADASGHHSGDVILSLPTQPADLMLQLINQFGGHNACKNTTSGNNGRLKLPGLTGRNDTSDDGNNAEASENRLQSVARRNAAPAASSTALNAAKLPGIWKNNTLPNTGKNPASMNGGTGVANIARISTMAEMVLPMAAPHRLLDALGLQAQQHLPALRDALNQAAMDELELAAARLDAFVGVASDLRDTIARTVWYAVYEVCTANLDNLETIALDSWLLGDPLKDQQEDKKCPTDDKKLPRCADPSCAGGGILDSAPRCSIGDLSSCPCMPLVKFYSHPVDKCELEAQQQWLEEVFDGASPKRIRDDSCAPQSSDIGVLTCDGKHDKSDMGLDSLGANRQEAIDSMKDFCKNNAGKTLKAGPIAPLKADYKPGVGNSLLTFSMSFAAGSDCKDSSYTVDQDRCEKLLSQTIDGCNTDFKGSYGKYGGHIVDGCASMSFDTTETEAFTCGQNLYANPAKSVSADTLHKAIDKFCSQDLNMDPSYDPKKFYQKLPDHIAQYDYVDGKVNVRMSAVVGSDIQDQKFPKLKCESAKQFSIKGDECKRKLMVAADKCQSGNNAGYLNDNTKNGCVMWEWAALNA